MRQTILQATGYHSQSARDAYTAGEDRSYSDYLEMAALGSAIYFLEMGDRPKAQEMLTRSLGASLVGNDGD